MQNIEGLLEAINNLKVLGIIGDICVPVLILIALLVVYFHQRNQIRALKDYVKLWSPEELNRQMKAYLELKETMIKDEYGKDLEIERITIKSIQEQEQSLRKEYEQAESKKSELEEKQGELIRNSLQLMIFFIQASMLHSMYQLLSRVQGFLTIYAGLGLRKKYPDAPQVIVSNAKILKIATSLAEKSKAFNVLSMQDFLKPGHMSTPKELHNFSHFIGRITDDLKNIEDSITPFLDRFVKE